MMNRYEVMAWLDKLPAGSDVAIDDGGIAMVALVNGEIIDQYLEIGGVPEESIEWTGFLACHLRDQASSSNSHVVGYLFPPKDGEGWKASSVQMFPVGLDWLGILKERITAVYAGLGQVESWNEVRSLMRANAAEGYVYRVCYDE